MNRLDDSGECPGTPPVILKCEQAATLDPLPEKSKGQYEIAYERFKRWSRQERVTSCSENVMLAYFSEEGKRLKASSLWSQYSMVKATLAVKENVNISIYPKLKAFLKEKSAGYRARKSKTFTRKQIETFLLEGPDEIFLMLKVALVMGIYGACRTHELAQIALTDIEDTGGVLKISVPNTTTKRPRFFTIAKNFEELNMINLYRKYAALRPAHTNHQRFFINYRNGRCSTQVVGVNTFGKIPSKIASYLKLDDPSAYTGHCFRRSSATLLLDAGGSCLKCNGHWPSSPIAEGHIETKIDVANQIINEGDCLNGEPSKPITSEEASNEMLVVVVDQSTPSEEKNIVNLRSTCIPANVTVSNCTNCNVNLHIHYNN